MPNGPTFAGRPHQIEPLLTKSTEQLLHRRSIRPLHVDGEGHFSEKLLSFPHLLNTVGGKGNHQLMQPIKFLEHRANQAQCRPAEFLHQAGNQDGGGLGFQPLAKQHRILQRQAVVVDGGDQTLLKIHSVISATTLVD